MRSVAPPFVDGAGQRVAELIHLLHQGAPADDFARRLAEVEALPDDIAAKSMLAETVRMAMAIRNRLELQQQLEVVGLVARGGGAEVGDLRVRAEPGRERHRHLGAPQGPLEGAREVAVGGEAQPAALGVADAQLLDGRRRRWTVGLAGHQTTVRGSRLRPVGPIWISVPMVGQTPQS